MPGGDQNIDVIEVMKDGLVRIYLQDELACGCGARATVQVDGRIYESASRSFDGEKGIYIGVKTPELKEGQYGYDELNAIVSVYDHDQLAWQGQMING